MFRQSKRVTSDRRAFLDAKMVLAAYPLRLSFYLTPPLEEITLEEFETWAIDRLKVLIEIELCVARGKSGRELEAAVMPVVKQHLSLLPSGAETEHERRKDHYSHFILRLVFCRSEELRKKFVRNETALFKLRYSWTLLHERRTFIDANRDVLPWDYIGPEEKQRMSAQLHAALYQLLRTLLALESEGKVTDEMVRQLMAAQEFIKVPFRNVPDLVAQRNVLLSQGMAYIPLTAQLSLLATEFSTRLEQALVRTFRTLPRLDEDDRLVPLLNHLAANFQAFEAGGDFSNPANALDITASTVMLPEILKHMPLCATRQLRGLMADHHLRYGARMQLGVFLKGIGLLVDEALVFWQEAFTSGPGSMNVERFNKDYRYNIRHMYGLEGSRTSYKPFNCAVIMNKPKPSAGEYHGCPYRDLQADALVEQLADLGITDKHDVTAVLDDVGQNNYNIACTRVFELTHKKDGGATHINHPNLYFDRSRQLERAEGKAKA